MIHLEQPATPGPPAQSQVVKPRAARATEQSLREALAAKDQFLSVISHELKSPLTVVLGNAWALANRIEGLSREQIRETSREIYTESVRLNRIVENLLLLARVERAGELELETVHIEDVIRQVIGLPEAASGHVIEFIPAEQELTARANSVALRQVIENLLSNARKYSPEGSTITVRLFRDGNAAVVTVSDRGRGIPEAAIPHLFEPFYRVDEDTGVPGMGVGLSVCQRLVQAMGGRVWASARDGGGATFSFSLRVAG
jgi:signal transduction histidine kinase